MIHDSIRTLLGEDLAQLVDEALCRSGEEVDIVIGNNGTFVSAQHLESLRAESFDTIEKLKAGHIAEIDGIKKNAALRLAIGNFAHDPDDIIPRLDLDSISLDESGNLSEDISLLLEPIRNEKPYLFRQIPEHTPDIKGAVPAETSSDSYEQDFLSHETQLDEIFGLKGV